MTRLTALTVFLVLPGIAPMTLAKDTPLPLEKRTYQDAQGKTLPYRLLKPAEYDARQQYPLVLFLHGAGERGADNEAQLVHGVAEFAKSDNRKKYPCFLIAPQCPTDGKWVQVAWSAERHSQPEKPAEPLRLALELIASLQQEYRIDARRLYITGLSMGGFGTWDAIQRHPDLFSAAVPVCGGGDETRAERIAKMPIWAFHGALDMTVKPIRSRHMIEALEKVGGKPRYTEYRNEGHASWIPAYHDPEMLRWLFSQRRER